MRLPSCTTEIPEQNQQGYLAYLDCVWEAHVPVHKVGSMQVRQSVQDIQDEAAQARQRKWLTGHTHRQVDTPHFVTHESWHDQWPNESTWVVDAAAVWECQHWLRTPGSASYGRGSQTSASLLVSQLDLPGM